MADEIQSLGVFRAEVIAPVSRTELREVAAILGEPENTAKILADLAFSSGKVEFTPEIEALLAPRHGWTKIERS
jgi:hypothetical protein